MNNKVELSPLELKQRYVEYIGSQASIDQYQHTDGNIRIATFNVHYFTDVFEKRSTYDQVIKDIKTINADIIILQEILIGGDKVPINENITLNLDTFFDDLTKIGYKKKIVCNSVPSWYNAVYGNIMLIHNRICDPNPANNYCDSFDETIFTFPKSKHSTIVSGEHQGTQETRCYIKCRIEFNRYTIYIYGTHLDVSDEDERLSQMRTIISDARKHTRKSNTIVFIMGDCNTFSPSELENDHNAKISSFTRKNGKVSSEMKRRKWYDCHSESPAKMTTWNGTRVDFIFCSKKIKGVIPEYMYSLSSDHIPVILTLTPDFQIDTPSKPNRTRRTHK